MPTDARSIARRQMGSEGVAAALKPSRGLRDDIVHRGGLPKNHSRVNLEHIRAVEAKQRAKREVEQKENNEPSPPLPGNQVPRPAFLEGSLPDFFPNALVFLFHPSPPSSSSSSIYPGRRAKVQAECKPPQPHFVLPEFSNVQSRVMQVIKQGASRAGSPAAARTGSPNETTSGGRSSGTAGGDLSLPGGMATACRSSGGKREDRSSGGPDSASSTTKPHGLVKSMDPNKNFPEPVKRITRMGEMPRYLVNRKAEWAAEHERKEAEKRRVKPPPGTTLLSEEERLETLRFLEKSHAELSAEMLRLPVTMGRSLSSRRKKEDMERKLGELEKALEIYKRDKVFLPL